MFNKTHSFETKNAWKYTALPKIISFEKWENWLPHSQFFCQADAGNFSYVIMVKQVIESAQI